MVAPLDLPRRSRPVVRSLRAIAAALATVVSMGGIPGSSLQPVAYDFPLPPATPDAQSRDASVLVTVRDGPDGAPVAGARVSAFSLIGDLAYISAVRETDPSGSALLVALPHGAIWIIADAPGRARGSTRIVVDAERRAVTLELEPAHTVDVVVKDEIGAPLVGAEVEVVALADALPVGARTAADGAAHVSRLGAGPWRATARAPGYEEASGRALHDGDVVQVVLRRLGSIAVHVADDADRPIAGAHVAVAGATLWPARVAETDAQGDVRIHGLAAGSYALRASRGDLVSRIELGVMLSHGEDKALLLRVARGQWVGVRVTDGDENDARGIAAARVILAEGGLSPFPLEATTDAKGMASLGPIAGGTSLLTVRADGFVPRAVPVSDPPPPRTLVALVRAGVLTGRVVDDRGYPIDGATIEIVGTDPSGAPIFDDPRRASFQAAHFDAMLAGPAPLVPAGQLGVVPGPVPPIPQFGTAFSFAGDVPRTAPLRDVSEPWVTRSDGSFRASPASPGRVRAIVRHPQYVEAESDLVTLSPGGEAHVDVVMLGGGALEGRVVDSRDRPVEGARVQVAALRGTLERTTRTASDGTFAFAALPNTVSLTASVDNSEDQPDVRLVIAIPERERKAVTIRLPEPRAPLAVAVVDDRDFPIGAAQLSATSLTTEVPLRTTAFTDARGDASLKRAGGLPLRVEASAPGHAPRVVTTDGTSERLRIELSPAESATGEVFASRGGDAVAGADVTFYSDLGVRHARSDARGAFELRELAPGDASLRVRAPRFASFSRSVQIPDSAGRRAFVMPRIELEAEGLVEGEVVDGQGDPIAGARVAKDHAPTWLVVGGDIEGVAVTNAKGQFSLGELAEGTVALEAFAPDLGRGRLEGIRIVAGRTTNARIILTRTPADEKPTGAPSAGGSVAVTLGETGAPVQVVIVSVAPGSEAERAGIAPGDIILAVDETPVVSMIEARNRLGGALSDDVVVRIRRGEREMAMRVAREAVRR